VTALLFASVALLAASVWLWRGARARAVRRRLREGPGTAIERAIPVRSFEEIDQAVARRRCHCGDRLRPTGEGTRQDGDRRYRFARLVCDECEEASVLYFDVSEIRH
jgi:hypothetical protein